MGDTTTPSPLEVAIEELSDTIDTLNNNFIISVTIISVALLLTVIMVIILHVWMSSLSRAQKQAQNEMQANVKIRRAQLREDFPPPSPPINNVPPMRPPTVGNNSAVINELKRTSRPNMQQSPYVAGPNQKFFY